jgi:hypothetical protein
MKRILITLVAVLLQGVAPCQQTASQQADTNWLDAPTPDGSPTLRETSNWLDKTLRLYGSHSTWRGGLNPLQDSEQVISVSIDNSCNLNVGVDYATNANTSDRKVKHLRFSHELDRITVPLGAAIAVSSGGDTRPPRLWIDMQTPGRQSIQIVPEAVNANNFSVDPNDGRISTLGAVTPGAAGRPSYSADFQINLRSSPPPAAQTRDAEIPVWTDQMVPRIVNAIQHAAALCQGTYKAPSQTREPF